MNITEFIDSYSDDLIYLNEAREKLIQHPFRRENQDLANASFSRLFTIIMIGSIEHFLEELSKEDKYNILNKYFSRDVSNGDRITALYDVFQANNINVEKEIFDDYLLLNI